MKKQIALALGVSFMSLPAFATKARLQALGEDVNGSQFISDNRNVFLNSATLNYHKDLVTMEWGDTSAVGDDADTPRAEGGFFKSSGNMAYGLYLGSESNTANGLRTASGVTNDAAAPSGTNGLAESNNLDLFFAGDAGVQWGANLTYHSFKDEQQGSGNDLSSDALRARLGVISGDIEGFANIGLVNKAEDKANDTEFEGKGSYQVGVTFNKGDIDYMAQVQSINAEDKDGDEFNAQKIWLGAAKSYKVNDMANVWVSGWVKQDSYTCDFVKLGATTCSTVLEIGEGDTVDTYVPVTIAAEISVKEWLTLRGSVSQNIYGENENDDGDKATITDTTVVNAGATLAFGDFQIDGVIGNSDDGSNVAGENTSGGAGTLRTDNLMSRVSMTYRF
jgi:hypothetical protein